MSRKRDEHIRRVLDAAEPHLEVEFRTAIMKALDKFPKVSGWRDDERSMTVVEMVVSLLIGDSRRRWEERLRRVALLEERSGLRIVHLQSRIVEVAHDSE